MGYKPWHILDKIMFASMEKLLPATTPIGDPELTVGKTDDGRSAVPAWRRQVKIAGSSHLPPREPLRAWMTLLDRLTIVPDQHAKDALVERLLLPGHCTILAFVNAHAVNLCIERREFLCALEGADILVRDGAGMRIALSIFKRQAGLNMNGTDLIPLLLKGQRVALMGSAEPWVSRARQAVAAVASEVDVALDGFMEVAAYVEALEARHVDVVVLGMGMPKQEQVACALKAAYPERDMLIVCGGAIIDFAGGRHPRAPRWMRGAGIEWLFRLSREPVRLFRRYIVGNPRFLARVLLYRLQDLMAR